MPLGGGTFQDKDKIIPGVYINIDYQKESLEGVTSGIVGCMVVTTQATETVLTDVSNYITKLRPFFDLQPVDEGEHLTNEVEIYNNYCKYVSDIFIHATYVYLIPYHIAPDKHCDKSEAEIEQLLWNLNLNVLVAFDYNMNSLVGEHTAIPFIGGITNILLNSSSRYPVLIGGNSLKPPLLAALTNSNPNIAKWIQVPYCENNGVVDKDVFASVFFLAGVLSTLTVGQSLASVPYTGSLTYFDKWIPKTHRQQLDSINNGQLCFYTLGNLTTPYVLKDITLMNWSVKNQEQVAPFNMKSGPVVRIEQYFYRFFLELFQTTISGKPNSEIQRSLIQARIYEELHRLSSLGVIDSYEQGDVTVEPVAGQENREKILVTIKYKPNYGIDYVYINVVVN